MKTMCSFGFGFLVIRCDDAAGGVAYQEGVNPRGGEEAGRRPRRPKPRSEAPQS